MERARLTRLLAAASVVALVIVATRCAVPDSPTVVRRAISPASPSGGLSPERAQVAIQSGPLLHGEKAVNWMAAIHTTGMQDFMAHRAQLEGGDHAAKCQGIEQMVRRQIPHAVAATGIRGSGFYDHAIATALSNIGCEGAPILPGPVADLPTAPDRVVTGSYAPYARELESAILSSPDAQSAANRMDAVLASAASLDPGDAEVLAGLASLGASSASYWSSVEQSGLLRDAGDFGGTAPMSIFRFDSCGYWCQLGWHDLLGAVFGASTVLYASGGVAVAAPEAVLAGSLIGGLGGSAAAAF